MNSLDALIAVAALVALTGGYRIGFLRRATGWAGMMAGIVVANAALPYIWEGELDTASAARSFLLAAALMLGSAMAGHSLGVTLGGRILGSLASRSVRRIDAILGAGLGVGGVAFVLWIIVPAMGQVPGWPARQARTSVLAATIANTLGSPPDILDNLSTALGVHGLPTVFDDFTTAPGVEPAPDSSPLSADVLAQAEAATVRLDSPACGMLQSGSGWVVEDDLVVTNAHVVAGAETTTVTTSEGDRYRAQVVLFDPVRDLAIVRVSGLGLTPLPLGTASEGGVGDVIGYPGGGRLQVAPFVVSDVLRASGRDIYDRQTALRQVLILGAELHPGNSGGPVVDTEGHVIGTAFAIAPDAPDVAYAIDNSDLTPLLQTPLSGAVSTQECTSD